nr:MAG TPA: hypothetical protein [Caudoviricetes sp.]
MKANNKYGTVNINGSVFKFNKTSNHPGAIAAHIEHTAQVLNTYRIAGRPVQLTKNFLYGEFVDYDLSVVTDWTIVNKHWAGVKSVRILYSSKDINDIVNYAKALIEKDKEFGKKLLNLDD